MVNIIAVDTETLGLYAHRGDRPFAVSMTWYSGQDLYFRFEVNPFTREVTYDQPQYNEIRKLLSDPTAIYTFHNCLFDLAMLESIGITVKGKVVDTMLLADAADNSRLSYKLKDLAAIILGWDNSDESALHKSTAKGRREGKKLGYKLADDLKADFHLADPELCKTYAIADTQRTMALFKHYEQIWQGDTARWEKTSLEHFGACSRLEHSLIKPVGKMNTTGMRIFPDTLAELKAYYGTIMEDCHKEIAALGYDDLNTRSPKQMQEVFYGELDMPVIERRRKSKDGKITKSASVDKKALHSWAGQHPLAKVLVELSEADKQYSGFIEPLTNLSLLQDGYWVIKPNFNIVGAHNTGRMSCSGPNLQNITTSSSPGRLSSIEFRLREVFGPRPNHYWLLADYEQIEVINAAYLSGDRLLIDTLEKGKSFHDLTNESLFSEKPDYAENHAKYRKLSKIVNFSMFYGVGPKKLAESINCDLPEAVRIWTKFWETYRGIKSYSDNLASEVDERGFVTDLFGRTYRTPPNAGYKAFNRIIQGTSAGMFKRAFKAVTEQCEGQVVACVHDEIILEVPNSCTLTPKELGIKVRDCMAQDFHKLIGKPEPLAIGLSITTTTWTGKEDLSLAD